MMPQRMVCMRGGYSRVGERRCDSRGHGIDVARSRVEPVVGLAQPELVEEDLRQLAVVVLARVNDGLVDTRLA